MLFYIAISGCSPAEVRDQNIIFERASSADSLADYFPATLNDPFKDRRPRYQNFEQNWYSSTLYSLKEPILSSKTDSATIYRMLWLRSFHRPVCFTIKEFEGDYFLNCKMLDRQPAFYPEIETIGERGEEIHDTVQKADRLAFIVLDTFKLLSKAQWKKVERYITQLDFWETPSTEEDGMAPNDGSQLVLEGRENAVYHFLHRRSKEGKLWDLTDYLIKTSGIQIPEESIY